MTAGSTVPSTYGVRWAHAGTSRRHRPPRADWAHDRRRTPLMGLFRAADPAALATAPLTYPEVGATRDAVLPAGYDHVERSVVVGSGPEVFERAVAAVFDWRAQRGAGLRVRA